MDVIPYISKDTSFPELPAKYNGVWWQYYATGPYLHDYLQEMNREVLSKYPVMTVAEGAGVTTETAHNFVDPDRKELNMLYHFDVMDIQVPRNASGDLDPKKFSLVEFKNVFSKWDSTFVKKGWSTVYLGNHDNARMLSRWGNDSEEFRERSSKLLTTFLLTMRATPYYYFGDELGMNNIKFDNIEDYRDIATKNTFKQKVKEKGDIKRFLDDQKITSRDNSRTPFQWDDSKNAGFTSGTPWIKVNPNHKVVNVETQEKNPNSVLNHFKKMVALRKQEPTFIYGQYTILDRANTKVYAYTRTLNGKKFLVALNFSSENATFNAKSLALNSSKLISTNYNEGGNNPSMLRPYEAVIYQL
jgi:oligo-1,6-glucosidase